MNRNVEIKARAADFEGQLRRARELEDRPGAEMEQEDVYFHARRGRLKMRTFGGESGELIQYHRPDRTEPAESSFRRCPVARAGELSRALEGSLGVRGRVNKRRTLVRVGRTRIHFDEVEGLGRFIELEVVMAEGEPERQGMDEARELMRRLEIAESDLIEGSYIDMLAPTGGDEGR